MSDHAPQASGPAPFDAALPVQRACHDFDTAWKAGGRPSIEQALGGVPNFLHTALLRALLGIDVVYRRRNGERPVPEEYLTRFPGDEALIEDAFRDTPTAAATAASGVVHTMARPAEPPQGAAGDWPAIPGYEILNQLTPGGMGVVYRARQVVPNRTVALKMIRTGIHAGPQERARFKVEAEAIVSLSHPHIIQIYDFGEWQEMPYLAMEFADGGSLAERLLSGPPPFAEAAELLETLARAVHFVHERGIIHRDLKPANILMSGEGRGARGQQKTDASSLAPRPPRLAPPPHPGTAVNDVALSMVWRMN